MREVDAVAVAAASIVSTIFCLLSSVFPSSSESTCYSCLYMMRTLLRNPKKGPAAERTVDRLPQHHAPWVTALVFCVHLCTYSDPGIEFGNSRRESDRQHRGLNNAYLHPGRPLQD